MPNCTHTWKIMHAGPIAVRLCLSCGTIAHLPSPPIDDSPKDVAPARAEEHERADGGRHV